MTAREQERLIRALSKAQDAVHAADVALYASARSVADDALAALGRLKHEVEEAR
jgi:hypothetical protein